MHARVQKRRGDDWCPASSSAAGPVINQPDCDAAVVGGRSDGGPNVDESIHPYRAISTINFFGMHEIKTSTRAGIAPYLPASRTF
jgi:hypothetical protein